MNTEEREVFQEALAALENRCGTNAHERQSLLPAMRRILDTDISQRLNVNKVARILSDRNADVCGVNREDNWNVYHSEFILDALAVLEAV